MKINKAGLELIKSFENCSLESYLCPAGKWTIGWGHTGPSVYTGQRISEWRAISLLTGDVHYAEQAVIRLVKVPLNGNQFSALVSFVFNLGAHALEGSTLLRKLNGGEYAAVPAELSRWVRAGGEKLPGLVRRRKAEAKLWATSPQYPPT